MNKYYLEQAAKLLSPALFYSQLHQLTKPFYSGLGQILMFHRVVPAGEGLRIHNHKSLEVTPEYLENIIQFFKKSDYQFISLDELMKIREGADHNRKFVVFTFDDGYVDNYTFAYPIFKKHHVPFTIYVATNMPDGNAVLWWYLLEDLIVKNSNIEFTAQGAKVVLPTHTIKNKELAFNKIRTLLAKADEEELQKLMRSLFQNDPSQIALKTKDLALSWDQIIELSKDPLVTIGSHTVNHLPLNSLSFEKSKFEILESKKIIESHLAMPVQHFCYPLGSYGEKEVTIMKDSGYASATTIKMANLFSQNLDHPFSMPRIMINSLTNNQILRLQVNGLLPALRNKFKRVVI
jgi:peptidoglycan/xylan/chitin deacetylase (PgdA/CDA1 family)